MGGSRNGLIRLGGPPAKVQGRPARVQACPVERSGGAAPHRWGVPARLGGPCPEGCCIRGPAKVQASCDRGRYRCRLERLPALGHRPRVHITSGPCPGRLSPLRPVRGSDTPGVATSGRLRARCSVPSAPRRRFGWVGRTSPASRRPLRRDGEHASSSLCSASAMPLHTVIPQYRLQSFRRVHVGPATQSLPCPLGATSLSAGASALASSRVL